MKNLISLILITALFALTSCQKEVLLLPIEEPEIEITPTYPEVEFGMEAVEVNGEIIMICSMPTLEYYEEAAIPTCGVRYEE